MIGLVFPVVLPFFSGGDLFLAEILTILVREWSVSAVGKRKPCALNPKELAKAPGVEVFDDFIERKVHIFSPSLKIHEGERLEITF